MKACRAMLSVRADQVQAIGQLEEGFVSNFHCRAQSFNCFKPGDSQVREAVMAAGRSWMRLAAALLLQPCWSGCRNDEMFSFPSQLWAASMPAAMGRWEQVLSCPLLIRGAQNGLFKQWEEAEILYSLPVPVLPWTQSLWVGGQCLKFCCPVIHCREALLPSLQTPALSTACMDRGSAEMFTSPFILEP